MSPCRLSRRARPTHVVRALADELLRNVGPHGEQEGLSVCALVHKQMLARLCTAPWAGLAWHGLMIQLLRRFITASYVRYSDLNQGYVNPYPGSACAL
jgi:hypothetical protein